MALPEKVRPYFVGALELPSLVFEELLSEYGSDHAIWDFQPYPERFSLKASIAHIADWNEIFRERLERTVAEDYPTLPDVDEGQLAIDRDYEHCDAVEALARFASTRQQLIETVKGFAPSDWDRKAKRSPIGDLTVSDQISLIGAHDAYHMRQVIDYRAKFV